MGISTVCADGAGHGVNLAPVVCRLNHISTAVVSHILHSHSVRITEQLTNSGTVERTPRTS